MSVTMPSPIMDTSVDEFTKNIDYFSIENINRQGLSDRRFIEYMLATPMMGMSAVMEYIQKKYHTRFGSQMWVDQSVSNDLEMTDMDMLTMEEVPFPSSSIEFYFEDPSIPTVLAYRGTLIEMTEKLGITDLKWAKNPNNDGSVSDVESVNFWVEKKNWKGGMAFRARAHNWNEMMKAEAGADIERLAGSVQWTDEEWLYLRNLYRMCIKVLAYASVPHLSKKVTKKGLPRQGKPGVKGRPNNNIFRVVYLPEIHKGSSPAGNNERKHDFKGRRGFIRTYRNDRYVNMKGKIQYIPPVPGPNGEIPRSVYKVRKP